MSIKAKRSEKGVREEQKEEKERKRADVVESITEVMIRKQQNDGERTPRAFFLKNSVLLQRLPTSSANKGTTSNVRYKQRNCRMQLYL